MHIIHKSAAFPTASTAFQNATGPIDYQLTNDYMFHAALQKNEKVLKSLICSLLNLQPQDIRSIRILNPIIPGEALDEKTFVLDINILLNDNTIINLEMQVQNLSNWEDRSLSYLCRAFDQLVKGSDYSAAKPVIHISFLNFTPFPGIPEFYASYKLLNEKNHHVYSDKFSLRVVDLNRTDLATPQDRACHLDDWARLFKATTWEEIKMIAKQNADLLEASETLFTLNADYMIRKQCEARGDYYRLQNTIHKKLQDLNTEVENLHSELQNANSQLQSVNSLNQDLHSQLQSMDSLNRNLNSKIEEKDIQLQNVNSKMKEKDILIAQLKAQLEGKLPPV